MSIDDGHAVHYTTVREGTPVYSSDGIEIGRVAEVVDNYREHILDGIVIETADGETVFADGPEVARTAERGVTLSVDAKRAASLPAPQEGSPNYGAEHGRGWLSRLLKGSR